MTVTLDFLGTGTSSGVPIIGCTCEVCTSPYEHDKRLRASVLVHTQGKHILIDTSPDLRTQLLRDTPPRIDGILYTHMHSDHTAGVDDVRPFNFRQQERIPIWMPANAEADFRRRFGYTLEPMHSRFGQVPNLDLHAIHDTTPFEVAGVLVTPIPIMHGRLPILGYRIGNLAYLTDVHTVPNESWKLLEGVDVMVTTSLKIEEMWGHMNLAQALKFIAKVGPREAYLSHIGHDLGREVDIAPTLPPHVHLAYDGLTITFN